MRVLVGFGLLDISRRVCSGLDLADGSDLPPGSSSNWLLFLEVEVVPKERIVCELG